MTLYLTLAVLPLLVLSALTSGTETAMTAASQARFHRLAEEGDRRAGLVVRLLERRERLIGALLLGNNLFNVLATALAADVLINLVGDAGVAYATLIMTALLVIFAEVLPKTYAIRNPDRMARTIAPAARVLVWVFAPITHWIQLLIDRGLGLFGVVAHPTPLSSSLDALRGAIDLQAKEGVVQKQERDMLGGILDLAEVEVRDVMTHRKQIQAIDADLPANEILARVTASPYSRIPLWRGNPDQIIGVLHGIDVLHALHDGGIDLADVDLVALSSAPWFIPDTTPLRQQLLAFQRQRQHLALVVDEYGDLGGLVTLEDILEEIVGEISDEKDVETEGIERQTDGSLVVDGWVTVRDLNRDLGWKLPDDDAVTVAGLLIHEARKIPEVGQIFSVHGFRFEVLGRKQAQIVRVRVTPPDRSASA
ncbi:MAG: HlyC/CorC family transporter [Pseudomonadota bacterium]